jgi:transcriptional regulator with XRE-family HTH domain
MNDLTNLSKIRKVRGKKQLDFASTLNMTQQNYSKIERGEREITPQQKQILAQEYGIPMEVLEDENLVLISKDQSGGAANYFSTLNEIPEAAFEGFRVAIQALEAQVRDLKEQNAQLLMLLNKQS